MSKARGRRLASLAVVAAASVSTGLFAAAPSAQAEPGLAAHTDPNLRNSWGTSTGPGLPIWVSDNATGEATLSVAAEPFGFDANECNRKRYADQPTDTTIQELAAPNYRAGGAGRTTTGPTLCNPAPFDGSRMGLPGYRVR